ncbi:GDSL-type esterase/lipase family protein [Streptomyces sp. 71268]|uniref:SGNH/GDSL hydrolase family protein n=1 Tax=Streptomyces sp. 71268 TaxID=3002640 RepID=UPI0023F720C6|nr:SGNH/GDSL hydrolase family protein [Streptomyces sp. 71268]WEV26230.1 GDSL-type esterase/lipase family protein [Streptomyces sp. 71268]
MGTWTTRALAGEGPVALRGALEVEATARGVLPHRLPAAARAQVSDGFCALAEAQPSGVRLAFRTEATVVELDVVPFPGAPADDPADADDPAGADPAAGVFGPPGPRAGVYDLVVDGRLTARIAAPLGAPEASSETPPDAPTDVRPDASTDVRPDAPTDVRPDAPTGVRPDARPGVRRGPGGGGDGVVAVRFDGLSGREQDVEIWLPHAAIVELVALRADAPLRPPRAPGAPPPRWVHHGSSISQGAGAAGPTGAWPAVAARLAGADLVNLGLSGNALLDPFTARAIRDTPADLISVKVGINIVALDAFRLRTLGPALHGFLDTVREGHPKAPLLVISPLHAPVVERVPGPMYPDPDAPGPGVSYRGFGDPAEVASGALTLSTIRRELGRVVAQRAETDRGLYYLDGLALYGERDFAELPLPDQLHPDDAAQRRIGERFARLAFGPGGPFDTVGADASSPGRS